MLKFHKILCCALSCLLLSVAHAAADTDGDGFSDDVETALGTAPNSNTSVPVINQDLSFSRLRANIKVNFQKVSGQIRIAGALPLPLPQGFSFAGRTVTMDVGGTVQQFVLDSNGFAVQGEDVFATIPGAETDGRFVLFFRTDKPAEFADEGFDNTETKGKVVTVPIAMYMNGNRFSATLEGLYDAVPNKKTSNTRGEANVFLEKLDLTKKPKLPLPKTTLFSVAPNPAKPNEPVTFSAASTVADTEGIVGSILLFGDNLDTVRSPGFIFANGATQTHSYRAERGYTARLITIGANGPQMSRLFIAVGQNTALNGASGLGSTLQRTGAMLQFAINTENVENKDRVLTTFTDTFARDFVTPGALARAAASRETIEGEFPTRSSTAAGITVAETDVVDEGNAEQASVRKQVTVSDQDVGASDALPAPPTTEITVTKMSGKFLFSKTNPDQVTLNGTIQLPTGFQPAKAGGNSFVVGLGNVVDQVIVDSKGKALEPKNGDNGRIKSVKITYPRLAKGTTATVGGETAKIKVVMSIADMDIAGFDTEGITAELREDEEGQTDIERYIQVGMVLDGVAFESVITVQYKVSTNSETGTFVTRASR